MTGNSTFSSIPSSQIDTPMADVEPATTALEIASPAIVEQKVSIAKNGKKRIQPMSISPSTSATTARIQPTIQQPKVIFVKSSQPVIEYDEPNVGSSIIGNKRKSTDQENTIQLSRKRPEWIDTAVVPPSVEKSQIKMGLPKVKSIITTKTRPDDPTCVLECHNGPNLEGKSLH